MANNDSPRSWGALTALPIILLGLAGAVLGRSLDGFFGGAVQGASIALLVLGAAVVGATLWPWHDRDGDDADGRMWLPSRDDR